MNQEHIIPMAGRDLVLVRLDLDQPDPGPDYLGDIEAMRLTGDKVEMLVDFWRWAEVGAHTNKVVCRRDHPFAKAALVRFEELSARLAQERRQQAESFLVDLWDGVGSE